MNCRLLVFVFIAFAARDRCGIIAPIAVASFCEIFDTASERHSVLLDVNRGFERPRH